jgi:hypothetical protein
MRTRRGVLNTPMADEKRKGPDLTEFPYEQNGLEFSRC